MPPQVLTGSKITPFTADVCSGLLKSGQKELPSKYLYDSVGSALFEVICTLPEYGLTRAEERLLREHANEIVDLLPRPLVVAELGSGTGRKTRFLLEALSRTQSTWYHPIEISATALALLRRELNDILSISIVGFEREYLDGLREAVARRATGESLLVLFLGSTIGNFDGNASADFLHQVRQILEPGDSLLLGSDLLKPIPKLLAAYDDPLGVTAAFNRNLLARINRELTADFNLERFQHRATFNEKTQSVEMHLRSTVRQTVHVDQADLTVSFEAGETIWTETSHKYSRAELADMAERSGFEVKGQWIDDTWAFAENLWIAR
jgi:L-histidine Nalpha-methyltransferase